MHLTPFEKISLIYLVRSFARILSVALMILVVTMIVGEGLPKISELDTREILLTVAFAAMLGGLAIGWLRELLGGILILGGFAAFMIVEYVSTGDTGMGWVFALFPLTGSLYLVFWYLSRTIR